MKKDGIQTRKRKPKSPASMAASIQQHQVSSPSDKKPFHVINSGIGLGAPNMLHSALTTHTHHPVPPQLTSMSTKDSTMTCLVCFESFVENPMGLL